MKPTPGISIFHQNRHSQRGQMALFVALIFQVLFVFFAMVINVGLLVHDKINLQNSADMAAIYGAQKQAELLNTIAHMNYQIRQSYKLLAWRIRVLGDSGRSTHPLTAGAGVTTNLSDSVDPWLTQNAPAICIGHDLWRETGLQNVCKDSDKIRIGAFQPVPVILGTGVTGELNRFINEYSTKMREEFGADCAKVGPLNWVIASSWYISYKLDQANRKRLIREIADNLSAHPADFVALTGGKVSDGIKKTLYANLTRSNKESIRDQDIQILNSLGMGGGRKVWLNEIPIFPVIPYVDLLFENGCNGQMAFVNPELSQGLKNRRGLPAHLPSHFRVAYDPDGLFQEYAAEPTNVDDVMHSSIGVEKNPWYMAYVGVKVQTQVRHPFAPFGKGVVLTARSFAQPFGGRIGPWHKSTWPIGSTKSAGQKIDPLLPDILEGSSLKADESNIPNYSRYPGDKLGLKSVLALASMREAMFAAGVKRVSLVHYSRVTDPMEGNPNADPVAYVDPTEEPIYGPAWVRDFEIAAVSPDLFDITYYSVEPNVVGNYLEPGKDQFGGGAKMRSDLGARLTQNLVNFTVADQVAKAAAAYSPSAFYVLRNPAGVLTAWDPRGPVDYQFNNQDFGRCHQPENKNAGFFSPGGCIVGGRVGYSVKIVSKDYLMSSKLPLGGEGITGPLKNPPGGF